MILWFLNLFPLFRSAVEARIRAEDNARAATLRAERAETRVVDLSDKLDYSQKRMIDVLSLRVNGHRVFEEADPTKSEALKATQPHRVQASVSRQIQTDQFRNELKAYLDSDAAAAS